MSSYNFMIKNMIYPFMDMYFGTKTLKVFNDFNKSQWFSREKIEETQLVELRKLLQHAYKNVPYYHKLFNKLDLKPENIRNFDDMNKLPILTKNDIRDNFNDLIAVNIRKPDMLTQTTGGSTGKPLKFMRNKWTLSYTRAAIYRNYSWAGMDYFGDKWLSLWGSSFDMKIYDSMKYKLYFLLMRQKILPTFGMNEEMIKKYIEIIRKFKPKMIRGYASALYIFAKYMQERGISDIKPVSVVSTAETLSDQQKDLIEEAFNCKLFNNYSSREFAIAQDCEKHEQYHIGAENLLVEFVVKNKTVPIGKIGKIIVTDFRNYAMPFIRYENGDLGKSSDDICECGRELPLMKSIEGRTCEVLVTKDGGLVPGAFFPHLMKDVLSSIKQYQVVQNKDGSLLIRIVKSHDYKKEDEQYLVRNIKKYFGNIDIDFVYVDKLEESLSGKYRPVVSETDINL